MSKGAAHEQTVALQQHLAMSLLKMTAVYLAMWGVLALCYHFILRDVVADYVMSATSDPFDVSVEVYEERYAWAPMDSYRFKVSDSGTADDPSDDVVTVYPLQGYNRIRALRLPLAIAAFSLGYAVIFFLLLRKSLGYFEELGDGVINMAVDRPEPLNLSNELAIMQSKLTEIREMTNANLKAAQESERRKNELVAYLAHDLRTPLTSVVGYLSLLDEAPDLPEKQRVRYVSTALAKAESLDALTGEFFEITRYNLSRMPIERDDVEVKIFLDQVVEEFYPELQSRSLEARVEAPMGETFFVDSEKMARAIGNVLRNACAYARQGTPIEICADRTEGGGWRIRISNQGREIAPEHLERIFDQFMREDGARSQNGHAGLGLAIAREIVQAHGGTISAESAEGVTTFTIVLP